MNGEGVPGRTPMNARMLATSRCMASLPLGQTLRTALEKAGFYSVAELEGMTPLELAREAGLSNDEALLVLRCCSSSAASSSCGASTAADLLELERRARCITTFCKGLDDLLGRKGGVCPGEGVEFNGVPGVGKTQLGLQLAVNVQIPEVFGGAGGRAIYVDTEGSFMLDRLMEVGTAMVSHLNKVANGPHSGTAERKRVAASLNLDAILAGITYFRIHDYTEQIALVKYLEEFVSQPQNAGVRLIVIDSIAFHMRQEFGDVGQRTRILLEIAQSLQTVASKHGIAVVVINQVTTKIYGKGQKGVLMPALGETWAHCPTTRVMMTWEMDQRVAKLTKSPTRMTGSAQYRVTKDGIRGLPSISDPSTRAAPAPKRSRELAGLTTGDATEAPAAEVNLDQ